MTSKRRPALGVELRLLEDPALGATPRWLDVLAMARRAETLGFDSLWVGDHLLVQRTGDNQPAIGSWECWSMLAALAAATSRIALGSLVTPAAWRDPGLLAEMAATVQRVSAGRVTFGLGAGWNEREFRAFGFPFEERVTRVADAIVAIERRFDALRKHDPDFQPPPIMIGSTGARMLRLIARHAAVWNAGLVTADDWERVFRAAQAKVDAACIAIGRDPASLTRTVNVLVSPLPGHPPPLRLQPVTGNPREIARVFAGLADAGADHLQVWLHPNTIDALDALALVFACLE